MLLLRSSGVFLSRFAVRRSHVPGPVVPAAAAYRFDQPILTLYRATLPFFLILLFCVLLITYWPWLSLGLVGR